MSPSLQTSFWGGGAFFSLGLINLFGWMELLLLCGRRISGVPWFKYLPSLLIHINDMPSDTCETASSIFSASQHVE